MSTGAAILMAMVVAATTLVGVVVAGGPMWAAIGFACLIYWLALPVLASEKCR